MFILMYSINTGFFSGFLNQMCTYVVIVYDCSFMIYASFSDLVNGHAFLETVAELILKSSFIRVLGYACEKQYD
jgi:hypothetical protein